MLPMTSHASFLFSLIDQPGIPLITVTRYYWPRQITYVLLFYSQCRRLTYPHQNTRIRCGHSKTVMVVTPLKGHLVAITSSMTRSTIREDMVYFSFQGIVCHYRKQGQGLKQKLWRGSFLMPCRLRLSRLSHTSQDLKPMELCCLQWAGSSSIN